MRKQFGFILLLLVLVGACGPKPYYETKEGKKKLKHYNRIQFGQNNNR